MNERKALFFDIDGTLFDGNTKSVLPSSIDMLNQLKTHPDYDLYLSTGRSRQTLGKLTAFQEYFRGMNLSNGQEVYVDGEIIYEAYLEKEDVKKLIEISEKENYPMGLITTKEVEMTYFTPESAKSFSEYISANVIDLNHKPFDINKKVMQVWLFSENDKIEKLTKAFPNLNIIRWGNYGADIIPNGSSKANGINKIVEKIGYKKENMYAFGDGDNDAEMFKVVGTSVAMGNASKIAKDNATFVTDTIDNDGLYRAVKKIGLI